MTPLTLPNTLLFTQTKKRVKKIIFIQKRWVQKGRAFKLVQQLHYCISMQFRKPLKVKEDVIDNCNDMLAERYIAETIPVQNITKALVPRYSVRKDVIISKIKDNPSLKNLLSDKIVIQGTTDSVDTRFFWEFNAGCNFANSQPGILKLQMNSENMQGKESNVGVLDYKITIPNKEFYLDHKAGKNMQKIAHNVLGERCYTPDNEPSDPEENFTLKDVQKNRLGFLETNDTFKKQLELQERIRFIHEDTKETDQIKNIQIQEEILAWMSQNSNVHTTLSFFVSRTVLENPRPLPVKFATEAISVMEKHPNMFLNKKTTNAFLIDFLKLYKDTHPEVLSNIVKSESFLKQFGLEIIDEIKKML